MLEKEIFYRTNHRYVGYYAQFIDANLNNYDALERELENISVAFDIAIHRDFLTDYLDDFYKLYAFLDDRGLYQFAHRMYQRAVNIARDKNEHIFLAKALLFLGRSAEFLGEISQA